MNKVGFWTAVDWGNHPKNFSQSCTQFFDSSLNYSQRKVVVIKQIKSNTFEVQELKKTTALPALTFCAAAVSFFVMGFIPTLIASILLISIAFMGKCYFRSGQKFRLYSKNERGFAPSVRQDPQPSRFVPPVISTLTVKKAPQRSFKDTARLASSSPFPSHLPEPFCLTTVSQPLNSRQRPGPSLSLDPWSNNSFLTVPPTFKKMSTEECQQEINRMTSKMEAAFKEANRKQAQRKSLEQLIANIDNIGSNLDEVLFALESIEEDPVKDPLLCDLIHELSMRGRYEEAIGLLDRPFKTGAYKANSIFILARSLGEHADPSLFSLLIPHIENNPSTWSIFSVAIESLLKRGMHDDALTILDQFLTLKKGDPKGCVSLIKFLPDKYDKYEIIKKITESLAAEGFHSDALTVIEESSLSPEIKKSLIESVKPPSKENKDPIPAVSTIIKIEKSETIDDYFLRTKVSDLMESGQMTEALNLITDPVKAAFDNPSDDLEIQSNQDMERDKEFRMKIVNLFFQKKFEEAEALLNDGPENEFKTNQLKRIKNQKTCDELNQLIDSDFERALPGIKLLEKSYLKDKLLQKAIEKCTSSSNYQEAIALLDQPFDSSYVKNTALKNVWSLVLKSENPAVCLSLTQYLDKSYETDTRLKEAIESFGKRGFFNEAIKLLEMPFYSDYSKNESVTILLPFVLRRDRPDCCLSLLVHLKKSIKTDTFLYKATETFVNKGFGKEIKPFLDYFYSDSQKNRAALLLAQTL